MNYKCLAVLILLLPSALWAKIVDLNFVSNLPLLEINTLNQKSIRSKTTRVPGELIIRSNKTNAPSDAPTEGLNIELKVRGSSSAFYPKKQFGMKLTDGSKSLLGLSKAKSYVLSGPYADKSLMRNSLAYEISRNIGLKAPHTQYVELILNKKYHGIYVLTEKIDINKKTLPLPSIEKGGFLLKVDNGKTPFLKTNWGTKLTLVSPEEIGKDITLSQFNWIKDWMNYFESSLYRKDYQKTINQNSFIDFFLLEELWRNVDSFRRSMFFHKGEDNKLTLGPVWDLDLGGGNLMFYNSKNTKGWRHANLKFRMGGGNYVPWFNILLTHLEYKKKLIRRWKELRENTFSDQNIKKLIATQKAEIGQDAVDRNFKRWKVMHRPLFPVLFFTVLPFPKDWNDEVFRLEHYLIKRAHWIDKNIHWIGNFKAGKITY